MIDIHSHILANLDDGKNKEEDVIKTIKEAYDVGFTDIITTPHYISNYFEIDTNYQKEIISNLKNEYVNLYAGTEIYYNTDIIKLVKEKKVNTLNNSKYLLVEFPFHNKVLNMENFIFEIIASGYVPIIAHPERYNFIKLEMDLLKRLIDQGALLQINFASVIGLYGSDVKKTVRDLLKMNMVHFIATDTHKLNTIYQRIPIIIDKLNQIIGKNKVYELTEVNPRKVLNNEDIETD